MMHKNGNVIYVLQDLDLYRKRFADFRSKFKFYFNTKTLTVQNKLRILLIYSKRKKT